MKDAKTETVTLVVRRTIVKEEVYRFDAPVGFAAWPVEKLTEHVRCVATTYGMFTGIVGGGQNSQGIVRASERSVTLDVESAKVEPR